MIGCHVMSRREESKEKVPNFPLKIYDYLQSLYSSLIPLSIRRVLFSAKQDVNDIINIFNNGLGKADIFQSFLVKD